MLPMMFPMPWADLIAFTLAGVALNLAPGSDVFFATASGIKGGPRAGAAAGLGTGLGSLIQVALAALGLGALALAYPNSLVGLRYAGAAYLAFLAWKCWTVPSDGAGRGSGSASAALRGAFWVNIANPKTLLFNFAFLPGFADPALGPIGWQILGLGLVFTATGTAVTSAYGAMAGLAKQALGERLGFLNRVAAVVFAGLAGKLILME